MMCALSRALIGFSIRHPLSSDDRKTSPSRRCRRKRSSRIISLVRTNGHEFPMGNRRGTLKSAYLVATQESAVPGTQTSAVPGV